MIDFNNFDSIQIGLASAETIMKWSHGEVTATQTTPCFQRDNGAVRTAWSRSQTSSL